MLTSVREMIKISLDTYKKFFRPLNQYMIMSLGITALFSLLLIPALIIGTVFPGMWGQVIAWGLGIICFVIVLFFSFQFLIGYEFHLREVLHHEKIHPYRQTLAEAKSVTIRSILASIASGIFTSFPLVIGIIGLFGKQTPELFYSFSNNIVAQNIAVREVRGVLEYFFVFLILYGLVHAIYFSVLFSMTFNAVIFDKKEVKDAFEYSRSLIEGRWWSVCWRLFAPEALLMGIYGLLSIITLVIRIQYGENAAALSDFVIAFLINFFIAIPIIYLPSLILYDQLKKNPLKK